MWGTSIRAIKAPGLRAHIHTSIMENQMEKNTEREMDTLSPLKEEHQKCSGNWTNRVAYRD